MVYSPRHVYRQTTTAQPKRRWLRAFAAAVVVLGGAMYLGLTNDIATTGYEISSLEQKVEKQRLETQKLEARVAEARSRQAPVAAPGSGSYVAVDKIEYLTAIPLPGVAVK